MDVLDRHRRFIHENAYSEGQPTQGHDIDGLSSAPKGNHSCEQSERDRYYDDRGTAPVAQKQQHHQACQQGPEESFPDE